MQDTRPALQATPGKRPWRLKPVAANVLLSNGSMLLLVDLGLDDATLLGSGFATDKSSLAVKVLGNFLEGSVLGLDVEEVDEDEFDCEPCALNSLLAIVLFLARGLL
jgi:hypothetical protein